MLNAGATTTTTTATVARATNALNSDGKYLCLPTDTLESTTGETATNFDKTRWYCWSSCSNDPTVKEKDAAYKY